jgi:ankyrin repeat protein
MKEVLQTYPKDEEIIRRNALNFYSKEKLSEGSVAFSLTSNDASMEDGSDDSGSSGGKSTASRGTQKTAASGQSSSSGKSAKSATSKDSKHSSQNNSRSSGEKEGDAGRRRSKTKKAKASTKADGETAAIIDGMLSEDGSIRADDASPGAINSALVQDEENMPLMMEAEHIPAIKERLAEEKVANILTASARGDMLAVQAILNSSEITTNSKDSLGRTPLHVAASEGRVQIVEYLMNLKADPTAKDKFGNTPFNDAVRSKHDAVITVIKKFDPEISFKLAGNELGVMLCQAAFSGRLDEMKRLVNNGVDPNESDYDGRTAMHLAASEGNREILRYLVGIKANIMCRDRFNGTPLEDAVRHHFDKPNMDKVQELLRDHGATLAGEGLSYVVKMVEYAAKGNVDRIRLLATNGVDVSLGDYDDRTPLHLAACKGNTAVLEYLLRQETVNVNAVDRFGGTPHGDALRHDKKGCAALLEESRGMGLGEVINEDSMREMIECSREKKETRLRAEREPKILHVLENSQESKMVALPDSFVCI